MFSVTDDPFVTSGGKTERNLIPIPPPDFLVRAMDGILLEGQEGPSTFTSSYSCFQHAHISGDQLYARRGNLPPTPEPNVWTTFEMPLREPSPMPTPFDLIRFLTSSITFMTHLNRVSVFLDDKRLARLEKTADVSRILLVPKGLNPRTEGGMMTIANISSTRTPLYHSSRALTHTRN